MAKVQGHILKKPFQRKETVSWAKKYLMQLSFTALKQITSFITNTIGTQTTIQLIELETTQMI